MKSVRAYLLDKDAHLSGWLKFADDGKHLSDETKLSLSEVLSTAVGSVDEALGVDPVRDRDTADLSDR